MTEKKHSHVAAIVWLVIGAAIMIPGLYIYFENAGQKTDESNPGLTGIGAFVGIVVLLIGAIPALIGFILFLRGANGPKK